MEHSFAVSSGRFKNIQIIVFISELKLTSTKLFIPSVVYEKIIACHYVESLLLSWWRGQLPWNIGSEVDPFPSTLVANTVTSMLAGGGQSDKEVLNEWPHISSRQDEAGMIAEPQILPEVESV